ncbi:MAG: hypothetical protein RI898_1492 [Actinomycetota bacterium]
MPDEVWCFSETPCLANTSLRHATEFVHEVFPTAPVLSQKSGMPLAFAEMIVNTTHTSPEMSGKVFKRAGARLSAMWPLVVDHDTQTGNIHSASKVTGLQPISD